MRYGMVMGLVALLAASVSMAQGIPSQSKLNKLGLSSMELVSDHAGEQVRGKAFAKIIWSWQAAAGEKAIRDGATGNVSIDPGNFVAHDFNNGAGITSDGRPLTIGNAFQSQVLAHTADAYHQQDILDSSGNIAFSEISSSLNNAQVFAGNYAHFLQLNGSQ